MLRFTQLQNLGLQKGRITFKGPRVNPTMCAMVHHSTFQSNMFVYALSPTPHKLVLVFNMLYKITEVVNLRITF